MLRTKPPCLIVCIESFLLKERALFLFTNYQPQLPYWRAYDKTLILDHACLLMRLFFSVREALSGLSVKYLIALAAGYSVRQAQAHCSLVYLGCLLFGNISWRKVCLWDMTVLPTHPMSSVEIFMISNRHKRPGLTLTFGLPFLAGVLDFAGLLSTTWSCCSSTSGACLRDLIKTFSASWTATPARQHAAGAKTSIKRTYKYQHHHQPYHNDTWGQTPSFLHRDRRFDVNFA